jgi:type I site-specific restriction-modification system R (restriction) subunit
VPKISLEKHQESASNYIATTPTKSGIIAHITGSGKSVTTIAGAFLSLSLAHCVLRKVKLLRFILNYYRY